MNRIDDMITVARESIANAKDLLTLSHIKANYLGKKGQLKALLKTLGQLPPQDRPQFGQIINQAKVTLQQAILDRKKLIENNQLNINSKAKYIDITLPGRGQTLGSLHPISQVKERIETFFLQMGFDLVEGPEIEDEEHNFNALNMPAHHPARQMLDTFYLDNGQLLRTHTSPVQIRVMASSSPPLRIIAPGRVYRRDFDATHTPMFHQIEGLAIDDNISLAHLKGLLNAFIKYFFAKDLKTRFRPSYFPFTKPSAEMDIECIICGAKKSDCRICRGSGWLEVLGCGMVHPDVLAYADIDSDCYSGLAFGLGIDRLAMLYYHINDLRLMFNNDIKFLQQF